MEMVERLLIHPDDVNLIRLKIKEFEEGKEDIFVYPDFRMLHKNGEVVFTEVKAIAVRSDTGRMIKAFGNIKNITERYLMQEQLRKSNERFELAARASYDILWDADLLRKNIFFSEGIKANLDIDGPLVITFNDFYTKMLHPDDVLPLQKAFIDLIRSKELNASLPCHRLKKADGSFAFVKAKMYGVRDTSGRLNRVIGVTTDITLQKQYEWNLEKLNSDLENQAHDLKQSNVELERFAYVASHDLQEPLRMVSSFLSLTKKRYADVLDDTGKQYIHFAVEGAERMKRLILDLLQFSKIGFNRLQKEEVNTQEICNDLRNEFIFTIKEKNATVVMDPLPSIVANKSQLIHVFRNLLGNALKYSAILPVVHIGCKEATDHWQFFVKDNGIGIDQKYFDKIFIIFQQLHVKNEYAGSGVGLAIAKKIVEQHGGRIWVESEKSHGSTFYFTIAKQ
jgi:signal transduction histidine kinase